jgi:hypothetical protein
VTAPGLQQGNDKVLLILLAQHASLKKNIIPHVKEFVEITIPVEYHIRIISKRCFHNQIGER